MDLSVFPVCQGVLDVIYNPRRTALLLQAEALEHPLLRRTAHAGGPGRWRQRSGSSEQAIPAGENERILAQLRRETDQHRPHRHARQRQDHGGGRLLARLTGREAVDLDQMIETHRRLFHPGDLRRVRARPASGPGSGPATAGGWEAHRQVILLTGGGVVKTAENYAALHQNGRIYQLVRDLGRAAHRGPAPVPGGGSGRHVAGAGAPVRGDSGTWRLTTAARWRTPPPPSGGIFVHILVVNGPNMNMLGIRAAGDLRP